MKEITITESEAGGRLDKLLFRVLGQAPRSFLYKMLRKKNITLNGKKAQGNEILSSGDTVKIYFSDETYEKFRAADDTPDAGKLLNAFAVKPSILYEDSNILLFDKPAGMLSQKAKAEDLSLTDYLNAYLLSEGKMTKEEMALIHPALCNRLDRNTSGLVAAGRSLTGLQTMNRIIKERSLQKYYRCIVAGVVEEDKVLDGYLIKQEKTNTVTVSSGVPEGSSRAKRIVTSYHVIRHTEDLTLLEVHLITGRSHQIRAHFASVGHPVLGDPKYGDAAINRRYRRTCGVTRQMLHAYRIIFPAIAGPLSYLSGREFTAPLPAVFDELLQ